MNLFAIYWASTVLLGLILTASALSYLFHAATIEGIRELGFPDFFRIQLAVLKCFAVIALLVPQAPLALKDAASVGALLFFLTALIAHFVHRDSPVTWILNIGFIGLVVVSHVSLHRLLEGH